MFPMTKESGIWLWLSLTLGYYEALTEIEQKKLAVRVAGRGGDFTKNMAKLAGAGIGEMKVRILTPEYVLRQAQAAPFAQATWLNMFRFNSDFVSDDCVTSDGYHLYGIPEIQEKALKDTIRGTRPYKFEQ